MNEYPSCEGDMAGTPKNPSGLPPIILDGAPPMGTPQDVCHNCLCQSSGRCTSMQKLSTHGLSTSTLRGDVRNWTVSRLDPTLSKALNGLA
jgi:hypothetical protein